MAGQPSNPAEIRPPGSAPGRVPAHNGEAMTGAQSLVRSLETVGVDLVFGIPGGAILPAFQRQSARRRRPES